MRAGILHFVTAKLITMVGSFAKCKARCKIISVLEPLWIRLFLLTLSVFVLCTNSLSNVKLDSKKSLSAIVQRKESQGFLSNVHHSTKEIHSSKRSSRRDVLATVAAASLTLVIAEPSRAQELNEWAAGSDLPTETLAGVTSTIEEAPVDWNAIYQKASKKALGGGKAGASAAVVQVLSLMWLRTSMNRQYRYGGDLQSSLKALWEEGGIGRLYQGLPFALIQGPLTRFGDTAANVGILALLESAPETQALPLPIKTAIGSISAGTWRILLMPIDSSKTAMQVEGADGLKNLWGLVAIEGPGVLYQGAVAQAAATAVGHFPWFLTYNFMNDRIPDVATSEDLFLSLARSAFLGLSASCVSDVCSNSLRVIKTTKQTARLGKIDDGSAPAEIEKAKQLSYADIVKQIIETDGIKGLFGRGLQTRLLTNAIQGAVFSVLWRYFQQTGGA